MSSIKRIERELAARMRTPAENAALDKLARLFATNPNGAMYTGPHVTDTGRALSPGRVTRKSKDVRQRARGEIAAPLPIGLGAHPKRLTPTPRHPDCKTRLVSGADIAVLTFSYTTEQLLLGSGLQSSRRGAKYAVAAQGRYVGYCNDPVYAMTWARAAKRHNIVAVVIQLT